ncbi:MAG: mechanosensitive ion channel family protein [Syntrophobacteraceae bacterium]
MSPVSILSGANPESGAGGEKKGEPQSAERRFPGLAEVVPGSSELVREEMAARERIQSIRDTALVENKLSQAELQQEKLAGQIRKMGDPGTWDFSRLTDYRIILQSGRKEYEGLLLQISTRLHDLETLRKDWEQKQAYWLEWKKQLEASQAELPHESFKKVSGSIKGALLEISQASGDLLALQERARKLIDASLVLGNPIEAAITKLRSDTFKQVEPVIFSRVFLAQMESSQWLTIRDNWSKLLKTESTLFAGYLSVLLVRLAVTLLVAVAILRLRDQEKEAEQWRFVLKHPWAAGILFSHASRWIVSGELAGSWNLISQALILSSASILASADETDRKRRRGLFILAFLIIFSDALKMVAFSTPLYRLYLLGASLAGLVASSLWARSHPRDPSGGIDLFSSALLLGVIAFAVSFFSQLLGFGKLSERVLFASAWTVFVVIGVRLAYRLSVFALEMTLSRPSVARLRFVNRYGGEFARRLTVFLKVGSWGLGLMLLTQAWGIFSSASQAWETLFQSSVEVAGLSLSLGLILLALFALYLASSISWFLRAFLEAEVFPRNQVDRGAGDAIKKLLHYFLVLIGFFISLSLVGIDAKSFFVFGGALGLGLGIGLQNVANNFISGLILLFERPIKIGDMVVVENESGRVRKIGLRSTVIETFDRAELIVPNSQFISQKVTNWTFSNPLARLRVPVGAAYGTDISLVLGLLKEVALANARVIKNPQPLALFVRFGESSLDFELHVWIADVADRLSVQSEIGQAIASSFRDAGIEIPFPQREVHVRSSQS